MTNLNNKPKRRGAQAAPDNAIQYDQFGRPTAPSNSAQPTEAQQSKYQWAPSQEKPKALLVAVDLGLPEFAASVQELALLVTSAGATVVETVTCKRGSPDPTFFIGSGKVDEVKALASESQPEVVIFDHALSPAQQRNLERELGLRVLDRTALILDIFALRARSHEGKLQVELAQLQHLSTRLVRMWTHLERQKGGIGLRGPGETQLETDKRLIGNRIKNLQARLETLSRQRRTQRRQRERTHQFSVSLVGYTNAGKSTLFNALSRAQAYAADQLFATLDTTTRRIFLQGVGQVAVSDTVGFIRDLPHALVAAFRATLEETVHADLLLHVVDASDASREFRMEQVDAVLKEIDALETDTIVVYNKIDLADFEPRLERDETGKIVRVFVSAATGAGMQLLRDAIAQRALAHMQRFSMENPYATDYMLSATTEQQDTAAFVQETLENAATASPEPYARGA